MRQPPTSNNVTIARAALRALTLTAALTTAGAAADTGHAFTSGPRQVTLLELYTSEGCSSCPPADRWLNEMTDDSRLWGDVVPVAFHVDYWDYIGWKDRFAEEAHGLRQQVHRAQGNVRTVYTPGLMLGGREWRGWFSDPTLRLNPAANAGTLAVSTGEGRFEARFDPAQEAGAGPILNIALLGFDLQTQVRAGENTGRRLSHGFVVLGYDRVPMQMGEDGALTANGAMPTAIETAPRLALAAWVERADRQTPLQAVGGWLD